MSKSSRATLAIFVVVLVVAFLIVGFVAGAYYTKNATENNGVQIIRSEISCGRSIVASFTITNFSTQTKSVQVQLAVGNQVLTQNAYALNPAGSTYPSGNPSDTASGTIQWGVSSCPSGIHLQLA